MIADKHKHTDTHTHARTHTDTPAQHKTPLLFPLQSTPVANIKSSNIDHRSRRSTVRNVPKQTGST